MNATHPVEMESTAQPTISVIVNNYNGARWLERCLASLRAQTIFRELEIIVADDASPDQSAKLASALLSDWPNGRVLQNASNLGYCRLNNAASKSARGRFLFIVNNDTWLEADCLERLLRETLAAGATVSAPVILNYADNAVLTAGETGFDVFGFISPNYPPKSCAESGNEAKRDCLRIQEVLMVPGCAVFIEADRFRELGGFDTQFNVFADEYDLCWRIWIAGGKAIVVPAARLHHRSMAGVNPEGFGEIAEWRTSDTKRYLANRNNLLVLFKNAQHLLLLMVPLQLLLLVVETTVVGALTRRWSHIKRALYEPLRDCWRLRGHVLAERRQIRKLRQRGDLWMLRFLRPGLNRWGDLRRLWHYRRLKVDTK